MYSDNLDESPEMKYAQQQIDREERKLETYKKKLEFEKGEQLKREEQFIRRQKTDSEKLETTLGRSRDTFKTALANELSIHEKKLIESDSDLQRHNSELEATKQNFERKHGKADEGSDPEDKGHKSKAEFGKSAEAIRINHEIDREKREHTQHEHTLEQQKRENRKKEDDFVNNQKRELEKLQQQHERSLNSFGDSWKRSEKFLNDKIEEAELMVKRWKNDFANRERVFNTDKKRDEKEESDHRAQHGEKDLNQNYSQADNDNSPNAANDNYQETNHRRLSGRW